MWILEEEGKQGWEQKRRETLVLWREKPVLWMKRERSEEQKWKMKGREKLL